MDTATRADNSTAGMTVNDLDTPAFVVIDSVCRRNAKVMLERAKTLNVSLRPHVKTHKTVEGTLLQTGGRRAKVVVSTLAEARMLFDAGFTDILYAVCLPHTKIKSCAELLAANPTFQVMTDQLETVKRLEEFSIDQATKSASQLRWNVWIEVDSGYRRGGVDPESSTSLKLGKYVGDSPHLTFCGLYTHAGMSYYAKESDQARKVAIQERDMVCLLAKRLREEGIHVPDIAVGSTPTCSCPPYDGLGEVTEVHPGNYIFYDTMQADIGACRLEDVAVFIVATIIGCYPDRHELLIDAGWTALSAQGADRGYGKVLKTSGAKLEIERLSQETGVVKVKTASDGPVDWAGLAPGNKIRILPYHSCAAAAMHATYHVVDDNDNVTSTWQPCRGW